MVALALALGPEVARADLLELLGPAAAVSPEGFTVAVARTRTQGGEVVAGAQVELTCANGTCERKPGSGLLTLVQVVPKPGAREVSVTARSAGLQAVRRFLVGPPASAVALKLTPERPVKNRDRQAQLEIEVRGADGEINPESAPPVLRANVGSFEGLTRVAPGRYLARYVLPTTRFPEVAVVVAFSAWPHPQSVHGALGVLRVPLASAVELPGQTEAQADFSIVIAGQKFGPVRADGAGRFKVPVVVPPGYGAGVGTAVDRLRNKRSTQIDLNLPPTDQLACVMSPTQLPADGAAQAQVLCATSDPFGKPTVGARVELSARHGALSTPRPLEGGVTAWSYTAPATLPPKPELLVASWKQGRSTAGEELEVALMQGPAASLALTAADPVVHLGNQAALQPTVSDALGRARLGARLQLLEGPGAISQRPDGGWAWQPGQDAGTGPVSLVARALGPLGSEPARVRVFQRGQSLFAVVTDLAGLPVPGQRLKVGAREVRSDAQGEALLGALSDGQLEVQHAEWPGLTASVTVRNGGAVVFPQSPEPAQARAALRLTVAPPVPVNVRLQVRGAQVIWWLESAQGEVIEGREVRVVLSQGVAGPSTTEQGRTRFAVTGLTGPTSVSVTDVASQVFALGEVTP